MDDVYSIFQLRKFSNIFLSTFIYHQKPPKDLGTKKLPIVERKFFFQGHPFQGLHVRFWECFLVIFLPSKRSLALGRIYYTKRGVPLVITTRIVASCPDTNFHGGSRSRGRHLQPLVANMWGWEIFSNVLPPTQ